MPVITVYDNVVSGPEEEKIPAHLHFGQFMFDQFKNGGGKVAQVDAETGEQVTYRTVLQNSVNLAASLQKLGLKKGDLVSLSSENRFEFTVASLAVFYCGGVLSTLNITYSPEGSVATHRKDGKFCWLDPYLGWYELYYLNCSVGHRKHTIKTGLALIPWFHAYGFITSCAMMSLNFQVVFLIRFDEKQYLETIQKYKVNMTTLVPPLAVFLAKHPLVTNYDLTSLNEIWCGAAPLSSEVQKTITARTGIPLIRQGYGLTEVTMACCVDVLGRVKEGSCGPPAPGMKIKVIDIETGKKLGPKQEGELWIKSPLRMKGYMGDMASSDALFDAEGYVRTGDIGYYDNEGYFFIVDRLKELIKYKGFQVAPAELEALLLQHPAIADCAVVGLPDEVAGELPLAFVVPQPGVKVTESDIVKYVGSKVSSAKHLRGGVIFVTEIPKNASGKILRRGLREMLQEKQKSKL
ncbi:luciferin 4-monooxygenase-like [Hyposmocoma kahamanoa]|uniref:luciferin 4-monooxygenase-like n=1 Tax=Hyposmocoma kahamanoa TaxID=1477025 RepID=UPI000E6D9278|nr:luciferin 4-monooxygenase-like [Hyposmocoma kahamanoa]